MQDIVPKKSIREITKPQNPGAPIHTPQNHTQTEYKRPVQEQHQQFDEYPHTRKDVFQKEKGRGGMIALFIFVILLGVGTFLHFQKSATIYITPEQQVLAFKNTEVLIPTDSITTLSVYASSTIDIKTSTGTPVFTKATGTVTIYNANSTEQLLVANTRLEAPDGKIYRLNSKITVPKASVVGGKSTPGSIQVVVTADKTGESYNTSQSDFTVPGLVGSPRYKNVYARTKGAISGGSETKKVSIDEKDKAQKIEALVKEKTTALSNELMKQRTAEMVPIQELQISSTFEKTSDTQGLVALQANIQVVDTKKLATILAKNQTPNVVTVMEFVENPENLAIEFVSDGKTEARIKVSGSTTVKTYVNEDEIKALLAGKPFAQFRDLIKQIQGIKESRFNSKPFWVSSFPQASRIFIEKK